MKNKTIMKVLSILMVVCILLCEKGFVTMASANDGDNFSDREEIVTTSVDNEEDGDNEIINPENEDIGDEEDDEEEGDDEIINPENEDIVDEDDDEEDGDDEIINPENEDIADEEEEEEDFSLEDEQIASPSDIEEDLSCEEDENIEDVQDEQYEEELEEDVVLMASPSDVDTEENLEEEEDISTPSDAWEEEEDISTPSDAWEEEEEDIATPSDAMEELTLLGGSFEEGSFAAQIAFYSSSALAQEGDMLVLQEDVNIDNTLYVREDVSLDLNSHHIYISTISEAINIQNAKFSLYDRNIDIDAAEPYRENIIEGQGGSIESLMEGSAVLKVTDGVLNLYNVKIKAPDETEAIYSKDTQILIDGAVIYGGDGKDNEDGKGGDGAPGIIFELSKKGKKLIANSGQVYGGNGGKGESGEEKGYGSAGLDNNGYGMINTTIYGPFQGSVGEIGGGNGAPAVKVISKKDNNSVYIVKCILSGGSGGSNYDDNDMDEITLLGAGGTLPSSYDSRDAGYVTSVKNQSGSGVCWAFAFVGQAEASVQKFAPSSVVDQLRNPYMDNEVDLSELHSIYYRAFPKPDPLEIAPNTTSKYKRIDYNTGQIVDDEAGYIDGETGLAGNVHASLRRGIAPGKVYKDKYPFSDEVQQGVENYDERQSGLFNDPNVLHERFKVAMQNDTDAMNIPIVMTESKVIYRSDYGDYLDAACNRAYSEDIKKMIYEYGAVEFMTALDYKKETKVNNYRVLNRKRKGSSQGHAMVAVGWDDNYPVNNFPADCRPSQPGALLVKNSWGTITGYIDHPEENDNGYMWFSYEYVFGDSGMCIGSKWEARNEDETFYYMDSTTIDKGFYVVYPGEAFGNVFPIKKDNEEITTISFYAAANVMLLGTYKYEFDADVKIYKLDKNLFNTNPIEAISSEDKVEIGGATNVHFKRGQNTVELDNKPQVENGDLVFVCIENVSIENNDAGGVYFGLAGGGTMGLREYTGEYKRNSSFFYHAGTGFGDVSEWNNIESKYRSGDDTTNMLVGNYRLRMISTPIATSPYSYKVHYNNVLPQGVTGTLTDIADTEVKNHSYRTKILGQYNDIQGWHVKGWTNEQNGTEVKYEVGSNYTGVELEAAEINGDVAVVNLYPIWEKNKYKIKFKVNSDYSNTTYSTIEVEYGGDVTLPTFSDNNMMGATFTKWKLGGEEYDNGATLTAPNFSEVHNVTVEMEAQFEPYKFSISFLRATPSGLSYDMQGEDIIGEYAYTDRVYGSQQIMMPEALSWSLQGYELKGWSKVPNGEVLYNKKAITTTKYFIESMGYTKDTFIDGMTVNLYGKFGLPQAPTPPPAPHGGNSGSSDSGSGSGSGGSSSGGPSYGPLASDDRGPTSQPTTQPASQPTNQQQQQNAPISETAYTGPESLADRPAVTDVTFTINVDGSITATSVAQVALDGWQKVDNENANVSGYYFFTGDNKVYTGWMQDNKGNFYHLNEETGKMDTGKVTINGVEYDFGENGKFEGDISDLANTGEKILETYTGGWYEDPVTKQSVYQLKNSEGVVKSALFDGVYTLEKNGKTGFYMFDGKGEMLTGCQVTKTGIYYFATEGEQKGQMISEIRIEQGEIKFINAENVATSKANMTGYKTAEQIQGEAERAKNK